MANIIDATFRLIDEFTPTLVRMSGELDKFNAKNAGTRFEQNSKQITRFGRELAKSGKKIQDVGKNMTTSVTAPIVAFGAYGVKVAAELEDSLMSTTARIVKDGESIEDTYKKLSDSAKYWGAETRWSVKQVAEAFDFMGLAGWDADMMTNGIQSVLNMATASGEDLALVADILTDGLTAFGYSAKDIADKELNIANKFADTLVKAATSSNTTIAQIGEAFKYAAPLAGQLQFSIEDVSIALAMMANSGIKSSMAGTSLRRIFTNLTDDIKVTNDAGQEFIIKTKNMDGSMRDLVDIIRDSRKVFNDFDKTQIDNEMIYQADKLGLEIRDASGELINMSEIYDMLSTHASNDLIDMCETYGIALRDNNGDLKDNLQLIEELDKANVGLSDSQKLIEAELVAQKTAMAGWLTLLGGTEEEFEKLVYAIKNSKGSAEEFAEIMENTLIGKFLSLKSKIEGVAEAFGTYLSPFIEKAIEQFTKLLEWFLKLEPPMQNNIMKWVLIAAAIGPIIWILGTIVKKVGDTITTIGKFGQALKKAGDAIREAKGTETTVKKLLTAFGPANMVAVKIMLLSVAIIALVGAITYCVIKWKDFDDETKGKIIALVGVVGAVLAVIAIFKYASTIMGVFSVATKGVSIVMSLLSNPIAIVIAVATALVFVIMLIIKNWNKLNPLVQGFIIALGALVAGFGAAFAIIKLFNVVMLLTNPIVAAVVVVLLVLAGIGYLIYKNWESVGPSLIAFWESIKSAIGSVADWIINKWNTAIEWIKSLFSNFVQFVSNVWNSIKIACSTAVEGIKGIWNGFVGFFVGIWDGMKNTALGAVNAIKDGINNILSKIPFLKNQLDSIPKSVNVQINTQSNASKIVNAGLSAGGVNTLRKVEVPKFAQGTDYFKGGIAQVSERGGEILDLPRGTRIYPHDESVQKAYTDGQKSTQSQPKQSNITIAKLADTIVVREDADIDKIANALLNKIRKQALNMA